MVSRPGEMPDIVPSQRNETSLHTNLPRNPPNLVKLRLHESGARSGLPPRLHTGFAKAGLTPDIAANYVVVFRGASWVPCSSEEERVHREPKLPTIAG